MTGPLASIRAAFRGTFAFHGRATRSEYTWYLLLVLIAIWLIDASGWREARPFGSYPYARLALVLIAVPQIALSVRRLHDMGFRGWWALLTLVPFVNLLLLAGLVLWPSRAENEKWDRPLRRAARIPLTLLVAALFAFGIALEPFHIPSESMKPALIPGDYLVSTPLSYGLPCFGLCGSGDRIGMRVPRRGDVVVFVHPVSRQSFVKRVIALPGEAVEMREGRVFIDGVQAGYAGRAPELVETLPEGVHVRVRDTGPSRLDDLAVQTVPAGHVFVMGDNRDNSLDSRLRVLSGGVGMVPLENLIARARWIVYSATPGDIPVLSWPVDRYFKEVR